MDIEPNNEDLLSVVVSSTNLEVKAAQSVVDFSQSMLNCLLGNYREMVFLHVCIALPEITVLKVLTMTRCVASSASSLGESNLSKIAVRLGFCNEVSNVGCFVQITCDVDNLDTFIGRHSL